MLGDHVRPDDHIFPSATKSCAILGRCDIGKSVHCLVMKTGFGGDVFVASSLVDMYAKCGEIAIARKVFDEMPHRNVVSWSGMISGYAQLGEDEEALKLFKQSLYEDLDVNDFTFTSVIRVCGNATLLELGKQIHGLCLKMSFDSSSFVGSSLVSLYSKSGVIEGAYRVFEEIPIRNIGLWNAMLFACAQHAHTEKAFDLFKLMGNVGLKPNFITFLCVLYACSHAGLVKEGQYYFELMKEHGIEAGAQHYASMVDLLGRAGKLNDAVSVIESMPIEPTEFVWGALLTGCRIHGNTELAAYAADRVFELGPSGSGMYVLLSNAYAAAGRWEDAARARKMLRDRGMKKETGLSWMEEGNRVHTFTAEDRCHAKMREIYAKLEEFFSAFFPLCQFCLLEIFLLLATSIVDAVSNLWRIMNRMPFFLLFKDTRNVLKKDELGLEIAQIALPAALALTADPIASLIDTAFIGHIGPVELAAVGVSIAVFNQISRIAIFPLVSVTTSFVAEEDTTGTPAIELEENENLVSQLEELLPKVESTYKSSSLSFNKTRTKFEHEKRHIPSACSALIIGSVLGLIQTLFLILAAKPILNYMGVNSDSPMLNPAQRYLTLRSLGAPAVLLSLAMQGIFRGFKDTKTPLYAIIVGDVANIVLDPIFIFVLRLGVSGAAIAHVISQYLISMILMWKLIKQVDLIPPSIKDLRFERFLKNGFMLLLRVIAVTFCVTLAASLAARRGSTSMAAFQICLQIWLATSLLADGLAVAGQAILAGAFAKKDYGKATATASRVLQLSLVLGLVLSVVLALVLQLASRLFTNDINVLQLIGVGIPFVAVTQPINALAFVFDGINYGASDFAYSAFSMVLVAIVSIVILFILSSSYGFIGIWVALSIYMSLRAVAGLLRIGTGTGPWSFLRG
ncbi:PPR domain-containing protein/MatE domain-containing protein [Cephalotus follicularis]|uniref:Protein DETOXIFICATION n=1 Tax=Cephalotus follicularis TaxID=3775 RepID=A0A1Q3ANH4_CEPFO|nr:PPR domain-containing protein/MatE domain-containing protein [Cephalotus follicularis]